jgi:hypothetical protein
VAGLAACANTNAATDAAAPASSSPLPDLSTPFTGLPLGGPSSAPQAAAPAAAEPEAPPPPAASSKRQQAQARRAQAGYRGGAAQQVAAPAEPSDDPELTPEQQVYKFKGQCWMETEKQRNANIDKRIELVDKCLAAKMKAANIKAN